MKHFSESKNSMIQSAVNEYMAQKAAPATPTAEADAPRLFAAAPAMAKVFAPAAAPAAAPTPALAGQPAAGDAPAPTQPATPQAAHEQINLLNTVLESASNNRVAEAPHANFFERAVAWVEHKYQQTKQAITHSDAIEAYSILEEYVTALLAGNTELAHEKAVELKGTAYSEADPNWAKSMITWFNTYKVEMKTPRYTAWKSLDDFAYRLPPTTSGTLRVGLIGDWGTGEPSAVKVLTNLFALKPDIIIHLGDIYYSGTRHEYDTKYHAVIEQARQASGQHVPVYNLPGNHDYYSGGEGFYNSLPLVNSTTKPGTPVQEASYFALFNDYWQLQGMDTGFNDNNVLEVNRDTTRLKDEEVTWHQHQLDKAVAAGRKIILLSHHQLFSRYEAIDDDTYNQKLLANFKPYIDKQQISSWFWGHEHVAAIYKPTLGLAKGRCIGNSAVPLFYQTGTAYKVLQSLRGQPVTNLPDVEFDPAQFSHDGTFYAQGFALLELKADKTGTAAYYTTADPKPFYTETL
ncbi:MAG: metallophosphoesterase [Bacteroidota bacterium]|nr:metallophosphoesterase [Bacteroidota bacterium]